MELNKKQKEFVLKRIAEGLETDEINTRAAQCRPPFNVSRQQVDFYRKSRGVNIKEIAASDEMAALRSGLALRAERITRLEKLFTRIERDLLDNDLVWLTRQRALGSGSATKFVVVQELNTAQIAVYRGLLDDIAKEMNERTYEKRDAIVEEEQPNEVKITVAYEDKKPPTAE